MMRFAAIVVAGMLCVGCQTTSHSGKAVGTGKFTELNLFVVPMAINIDGVAGADAVAIQFFAVRNGKAKGCLIPDGTLEVHMLDGHYIRGDEEDLPTLKTWTYTAEDLRQYGKETLMGQGYELLLVWDKDNPPTRQKVTIVLKYESKDGETLLSNPGIVVLSQ